MTKIQGDRHGPNSWESYLQAHQKSLDQFTRSGFLVDDRLTYAFAPPLVVWMGELYCLGDIEIHVWKRQDLYKQRGRWYVETQGYNYQVIRRLNGRDVRELFRYDNAHAHEGHEDAHHYHAADGQVIHIGRDRWPTLGEVIEEARAWWEANIQP